MTMQKIKINSQKSAVNTFRKYCVYNSSQEVKQSPTKNILHKKNLKRKTVINDFIYNFELVSEPNLSATFTNGSLFNVSNVEPLVLRKKIQYFHKFGANIKH